MAVKDEKNYSFNDKNINKSSLYVDLGAKGRYCLKNRLNELTGKEWIKFSKSWFVHNPPPRGRDVISHPAKFPETLAERYISFFTKRGEKVLDPMAGTGTVNFVCDKLDRISYSIELEKKYYKIAKKRSQQQIFLGDCRNIKSFNIPIVDFIITSPPYWDSLKRSYIRQMKRKENGFDTEYSTDSQNYENIEDYNDFVEELVDFYVYLKQWLKIRGYIVIIVNNIYKNGKLYPLAYELAIKLSRFYTLKDEQIWCQDNKRLVALGINNAYVGNRHHVYCLIFRND